MRTTNRTYANRRLHSQLTGKTSKMTIAGEFGKIELQLVAGGKYRLTAINKETKQHFVKYFATLPGAMVAFDTLKENWV